MNITKKGDSLLKIALANETEDKPPLKYFLNKHAGNTVESIIRKQGHNISKLARYMKISRCTLYNWFEQGTLPFDVLIKIGSYINYDFSADFPEIFCLNSSAKPDKYVAQSQLIENEDIDHWMRKYILLLEKYNECLLHRNDFQEPK